MSETFTLSHSKITTNNLLELLNHATTSDKGIYYVDLLGYKQYCSYHNLSLEAQRIASLLITKHKLLKGNKVILQIQDINLMINSLWACYFAGYIPVLIPLISSHPDSGEKFDKLLTLFDQKNIIFDNVMQNKLSKLSVDNSINIEKELNSIHSKTEASIKQDFKIDIKPDDTAIIVFTSGSTGGIPKGVELTHSNIINSIFAKIDYLKINSDTVSFNWMDLTHVAGIVECHLRDLACRCNQIHAYPSYIVSSPEEFIRILSEEKVTITFTPNFFLGIISNMKFSDKKYDLSNLKHVIIGGELVLPNTLEKFLKKLSIYGLTEKQLTPAFGMTETCAGSIYCNGVCLSNQSTTNQSSGHVSLGFPISSVEMRIVTDENEVAANMNVGKLQLKGKAVFIRYYQNRHISREKDGWFTTGDVGFISNQGLCLIGRNTDNIIINGLNYDSLEIEVFLENEITSLSKSYTAVFSIINDQRADTEELVIIFNAEENLRYDLINNIRQKISQRFGIVPTYIIHLEKNQITKSNLGKIQRKILKDQFLKGKYDEDIEKTKNITRRDKAIVKPTNEIEKILLEIYSKNLNLQTDEISINDDVFSLGMSSLQIILLTHFINKHFKTNYSSTYIFQYPSIKQYAKFLSKKKQNNYEATIFLNSRNESQILFCIPPYLGEAMVFLELAKLLDNRICSFQGKGLLSIEDKCFKTVQEAAKTYIKAMKKIQSKGPYHIIGYSFGAFVLYEVAKQLEKLGDKIAFLGNFDGNTLGDAKNLIYKSKDAFGLSLSLLVVGLNLMSIGIKNEYDLDEVHEKQLKFCNFLSKYSTQKQYEYILKNSSPHKIKELNLAQGDTLKIYTKMAYNSFELIRNYQMTEKIKSDMHIFYAGKRLKTDLLDWQNVVSGEVYFIPVDAHHFNMFQYPAILDLVKKLKWFLKKNSNENIVP